MTFIFNSWRSVVSLCPSPSKNGWFDFHKRRIRKTQSVSLNSYFCAHNTRNLSEYGMLVTLNGKVMFFKYLIILITRNQRTENIPQSYYIIVIHYYRWRCTTITLPVVNFNRTDWTMRVIKMSFFYRKYFFLGLRKYFHHYFYTNSYLIFNSNQTKITVDIIKFTVRQNANTHVEK